MTCFTEQVECGLCERRNGKALDLWVGSYEWSVVSKRRYFIGHSVGLSALVAAAFVLPVSVATGASTVPTPTSPVTHTVTFRLGGVHGQQVTGHTPDGTLRVSGPAGALVTATLGVGSLQAEVAPPVDLPGAVKDVGKAPSESSALQAIRLGMPYDQAVATFGGDFDSRIPTRTQAAQAVAAEAAKAANPVAAVTSPVMAPASFNVPAIVPAVTVSSTVPYDSTCFAYNGDGGNAQSYSCNNRYLISAVNGDWWFIHRMKGSAREVSPYVWHALTSFTLYAKYYYSGNYWTDWDPSTHLSKGSCTTSTVSVTALGAGFSTSGNVCASGEDPVLGVLVSSPSSHYLLFGSKWSGFEYGTYTGTVSIGTLHNPPGVLPTQTTGVGLTWRTTCC